MFLLLTARSFIRGWQRKLLAVVSIALGASLAAAMLILVLDVGDKVGRELRTYGANITVKPKTAKISDRQELDFDPLAAASFLSEADLMKTKMIFWANNILAFAPFLYGQAQIGPTAVPVAGTWFNKKLVLETGETLRTGIKKTKPWIKVTGGWPAEDAKSTEALIGVKAAKNLGVKSGRLLTVTLAGRPLTLKIKGVLTAGDQLDDGLIVPLALVQERLGFAGKISEAEVSALTTPENKLAKKYQRDPKSLSSAEWERWYCTPYVDAISYQIEEVMPGSAARPFRQVAQAEGQILAKIQLLMFLLTVAALSSSALAISSLMTAMVLERSGEVGLAKALGATDGLVIAIFLAEAALLGLIGGGAGYGLGLAFAQAVAGSVFGSAITLKAVVLPITVFISLLVTLGGSLAAIRTIMRLNPKEVLHG